eukprot:gene1246-1571_t
MKILKRDKDQLITNYEVLNLLKHKRKIPGEVLLNEFTSRVTRYLETTPAKRETSQSLDECKKKIVGPKYGLVSSEILQLMNTAPSTEVEIYLIVEECEDRLNPLELLEDIQNTLKDACIRDKNQI